MGLIKLLFWVFFLFVLFAAISVFVGTFMIAEAILTALFSPVLWIAVIALLTARFLFKRRIR